MKKLLLASIMMHISLNCMENNDFERFKQSLELALGKCKSISDNDKRFSAWKKDCKNLYKQLPNNQQALDQLLDEAHDQQYSNPVFHFLVHTKIKALKPKTAWSWFSKKTSTNIEKEHIEYDKLETIKPITNEQLENFVEQTAHEYSLLLPYTELAQTVWNTKKVPIINGNLERHRIFKNEVFYHTWNSCINKQIPKTDLHYLSFLPGITSVKALLCFNKQLNTLPENVSQLAALVVLSLSNNELTDLPESLSQLQHLEILSLASNKFIQLPEVIAQLTKLKHLNLANNQFTTLKKLPASLESLQVQNNQLTEISSILQCPQLEYIMLDNNPLSKTPYKALGLKNLKAFTDHEGTIIRVEKKSIQQ